MSETAIERAIRFRRQDAALHCDLAILADAYIAHLDEHVALAVPYDLAWLESLPQFFWESAVLMSHSRIDELHICCDVPSRWYLWRPGADEFPIPTPATKADVIKLLEVFS